MKRVASLALVLSVAVPSLAAAASFADRQEAQANRIERGRENGSIRWTEGIKLRAEQNRIARTKTRLEADGGLSRSDRITLSNMQDDAAQSIRAERNDKWRRLFNLPRVGK